MLIDASSTLARRGVIVSLLAVLAVFSARAARAQATDDLRSARLERSVDATIKPGQDFFAYANGRWLKDTELPPGKERWGARNELEALNRQRVAVLLDETRSARAGTTARKVADFRAAYLNEVAIEARGMASVAPVLDSIARLRDKAGLAVFVGRQVPADVDPLGWGIYESSHVIGLSVEQSIHGEKNNVAFLTEGGLGLPSRDDYLSADSTKAALRERYVAYIGRMLSLAGVDRAAERAAAVMELETALARTHATPEASALDHNADSVWGREHFEHLAPGMDWPAFLAAAGLGREREIAVWQPGALRGLAALVASQPLTTWQDYLRFHVLHRYADVLPHAFAEQALAMRAATMAGAPPSRAERAQGATLAALPNELGRLYAERFFPPNEKARIERISNNVRAAFITRVEAAAWMSPSTRAGSLEKLRTLYVGIGYPDTPDTDPGLRVDPADPLANMQRTAARARRIAVERLGQPVDLKRWFIPPHTVGALLVFQQNSYVMSAALLEPPKYERISSDAAAYGSVGALIGHDITHYVDVLGADYDTEHRLRHWWTPEDMQRFNAAARPLADQFAGYQPFPGLSVNGTLTLTENVADLGGLAAAFDAYRQTLGDRARDSAFVRQQDREFFIAFAQTLRRKVSDVAMRAQVATNDHAPENYRADTVRNLDAWYDAFDVRPGQPLYLEPSARVRVW